MKTVVYDVKPNGGVSIKKDLLVFAPEGFEDTELITSLDVFHRAGLTFTIFSLDSSTVVKGNNVAQVNAKPLSELNAKTATSDYRGLFIPGGPGYEHFLKSQEVLSLIKEFKAKGLYLAAICAAPEVFLKAGVVDHTTITSYPGYAKSKHNSGKEFEVADNVITGRDYRATVAFADAVVMQLKPSK